MITHRPRGITLDTGALIAADANDAEFWRAWKRAARNGTPITLPAVVLAQAWRDHRQALLARAVKKCTISVVDETTARTIGELLGAAKMADVIDAAVVVEALHRDNEVWTSDPGDLVALAEAVRRSLRIVVF